MKKLKFTLLLIVAFSCHYSLFAQITLNYAENKRLQQLNQYTSVFVSSPNNGTILQDIHDDSDQATYFNSDRFFYSMN